MPRGKDRQVTRRRWIVWLPAIALLAAACGGGAPSDSGIASLHEETTAGEGASTTTSAAVDPEQAFLDFAACMREHGVDMPDPEISSAGGGFAFGITVEGGPAEEGAEEGPISSAELDQMMAANEACQHFLEGVVQEFEMPDMSEMQDQMLAFAQCMREHGVDMPDPEFSEDGAVTIFGGPGDPGMDPGDPTFREANEACNEIFGGEGSMGIIVGGTEGSAGLSPGGGLEPLPGTDD
jgi:hypothetical protein